MNIINTSNVSFDKTGEAQRDNCGQRPCFHRFYSHLANDANVSIRQGCIVGIKKDDVYNGVIAAYYSFKMCNIDKTGSDASPLSVAGSLLSA